MKLVTEEKLKKLLIESGLTKEKAEFQIKMAKKLGSEIKINGQFYGLKA